MSLNKIETTDDKVEVIENILSGTVLPLRRDWEVAIVVTREGATLLSPGGLDETVEDILPAGLKFISGDVLFEVAGSSE